MLERGEWLDMGTREGFECIDTREASEGRRAWCLCADEG